MDMCAFYLAVLLKHHTVNELIILKINICGYLLLLELHLCTCTGTDLFHLIGGKKRSIPFRRQRMQIDELTPPPATSAYPVPQPDDPYIADLLQMADMRLAFPRLSPYFVTLPLKGSEFKCQSFSLYAVMPRHYLKRVIR